MPKQHNFRFREIFHRDTARAAFPAELNSSSFPCQIEHGSSVTLRRLSSVIDGLPETSLRVEARRLLGRWSGFLRPLVVIFRSFC